MNDTDTAAREAGGIEGNKQAAGGARDLADVLAEAYMSGQSSRFHLGKQARAGMAGERQAAVDVARLEGEQVQRARAIALRWASGEVPEPRRTPDLIELAEIHGRWRGISLAVDRAMNIVRSAEVENVSCVLSAMLDLAEVEPIERTEWWAAATVALERFGVYKFELLETEGIDLEIGYTESSHRALSALSTLTARSA